MIPGTRPRHRAGETIHRALAGVAMLALALALSGCETVDPVDSSPSLAPTLTPSTANAAGPPGSGTALDRIAFQSNLDGDTDIWVMHEDGSGLTRLTPEGADQVEPAFSRDGRKIAFARIPGSVGTADIWVMDDDGSNPVQLTSDAGEDRFPAFSPDGSTIAFESDRDGDWDVYLMDAETGANVTRLTGSEGEDLSLDHQPEFSPDGDRLAFFRSSLDPNASFFNAIFVMDLATGTLEQVTVDDLQAQGFPTFSPDGTQVALQGFLGSVPGAVSDVWTVNATEPPDGDILNDRFNVTDGATTEDGHPSFELDGDRIAYAHDADPGGETFESDIFIINADGSGRMQLSPSGLNIFSTNPSWGPPASPRSRQDCMGDGWRGFGFANLGQCIRFVMTGQDSR